MKPTMQQREKILFRITAGVVVLFLLWMAVKPTIVGLFIEPVDVAQSELDRVNQKLADQAPDLKKLRIAGQTLKQVRARSLPPDPLDAQRLYQVWLNDLAELSGLENVAVVPGRRISRNGVFTAVQISLTGKARLQTLSRFLYHFYRVDLAQRVVDLTVESPATSGDPLLTVSLTAEGLSFPAAPERTSLFPQTTLAGDYTSGSGTSTMEVADASGFPDKAGYRIRIDNEYLTVTAVDGTRWTVRGAVDETRAGSHRAGDVVELAPIHGEFAARTPESYRQLIANNPFVKPAPPTRETPIIQPERPIASVSDPAAETYLRGSVTTNGQPQAWLYGKSPDERIVIHRRSKIDVGDVQAVVVDILDDHVLLESDGAVWKLELGDNLRSMRKIAVVEAPAEENEPQPAADQPPVASKTPAGA